MWESRRRFLFTAGGFLYAADAEDERLVATFSPDDPPVWRGLAELSKPGMAASFKLYAVTEHGNERGSKPVTVTRPPG